MGGERYNHRVKQPLFSLLILLFLISPVYCQPDVEFWWPEVTSLNASKPAFALGLSQNEVEQMKKLWKQLAKDPKDKYYSGTFGKIGYEGGYLLRVSSERGFILIPYSDEDKISDYSYGTVTETNAGEFVLKPEKALRISTLGQKQTPFVWIPLLDGQFVVPVEEIESFADYYGGFGIYNGFPRKFQCDGCGTFARRLDNGAVSSTDLAPQKYLKYIKQPIQASIISIGRKYKAKRTDSAGFSKLSSVTNVKIDVGSTSGTKPGLMFFPIGAGDNSFQIVRVIHVYRRTSDAELVRQIDKTGREVYDGPYDQDAKDYVKIPYPPIRLAVKITTSPVLSEETSENGGH